MEPRRKKNCRLTPSEPLPIMQGSSGDKRRFRGTFNGFCVSIADPSDMPHLISMGYFGKANLSRNYPEFQKLAPEILRKRVFESRHKNASTENNTKSKKVIVIPDSDCESTAEYFTDLKPEYKLDFSGISESVNLGLEEAFFLSCELECLDVLHERNILKMEEMWDLFEQSDKFFPVNYIVYYYFRAKNWVVKPGIKFGGDFLLYKQGPPFYHASYVVIIQCIDKDLEIISSLRRRSMSNLHLMGLHRLCETAGKELLICEVIIPDENFGVHDLDKFVIKETIMKRWKPTADTKH